MLGYSKEELKTMEDNYQISSKYAIDIIKNYGTMEAFVEAYKKCQCNYNFKNNIFCGFRGITISKNDITEYQKLQYALAIKKILSIDISHFEFSTGKYIDIDQFEQIIMTLPERMGNIYRYYNALLDGKKYTMAEIGNMYNISSQRISEIMEKAVRMLSHPSRNRYLVRNYKEDYREMEEYNKEIEKLKTETEDLQIINDYLSNKDYIEKNIELSNIVVDKDKLTNLNKENIINIQDLMQKCYNETRESLKEINIYDLNFSARTYNCLNRWGRINTLYDLLNSRKEELFQIRTFGENTYKEIIHKLTELGLHIKKDSFDKLEFSVRTKYCLKRAGIENLNDLLNLTENELLKVEGLGSVIYDEIISKISIKGLRLKNEGEEKNKNITEYEDVVTNVSNSTAEYFKFNQKNKLEKLEEIINKKDYVKNKMERYCLAVEQYLNNEDIFDSSYTIPAITLNKEDLENFDNIKKLLDDLEIISNDNIIEYENAKQINENQKKINDIKMKLEKFNEFDKHIQDIEWKLENDREDIEKVDKHIIERELSKIDILESEWLVLKPSKSIKNTNFLQIYIDENFENDEKEKHGFHIELGYEDAEGAILIEKDGLTMEEALKIFIDYFENNLPDIKDWYVIEI